VKDSDPLFNVDEQNVNGCRQVACYWWHCVCVCLSHL